jgi:hypothetical protein
MNVERERERRHGDFDKDAMDELKLATRLRRALAQKMVSLYARSVIHAPVT